MPFQFLHLLVVDLTDRRTGSEGLPVLPATVFMPEPQCQMPEAHFFTLNLPQKENAG